MMSIILRHSIIISSSTLYLFLVSSNAYGQEPSSVTIDKASQLLLIAKHQINMGEIEAATKQLNKCAELNNNMSECYYLLLQLYIRKNDWKNADVALAAFNLAVKKEDDEFFASLQYSNNLQTKYGLYYYYCALVAFHIDPKNATRIMIPLHRQIHYITEFPELYYNTALISFKVGDTTLANFAINRLIDISPEYKDAKVLRKKIMQEEESIENDKKKK